MIQPINKQMNSAQNKNCINALHNSESNLNYENSQVT